jgi:clostripain
LNSKRYLLPAVVALGVLAAASRGALAQQDSAAPRAWTILVYGAADNSADEPLIRFLDKLRRAIDDDPGLDLLLCIDRNADQPKEKTYLGEDFTTTRLYRLRKASVERLAGGSDFPQITADGDEELNSADPANLGRFIEWGKHQSPAQHYALMIYSHANGCVMCPDVTDRANMTIPDLSDKLPAPQKVDFLALELCRMGGIEIAYQWRPGSGRFEAEVMLAIPNAGAPLDWNRAFARIRSPGHTSSAGSVVDPATMTPADFGRLVIDEGHRGRKAAAMISRNAQRESAGCYDLTFAADVKRAIDELSAQLARTDAKNIVRDLCGTVPNGAFRYDQQGANVDLYDLCKRIAASDRLPQPARTAANDACGSLEKFVVGSFGMKNYDGFESGKNGVYIVLPPDRPDAWKQFEWYIPGPGKTSNHGGWSFLKDGSTPGNGVVENWFELLVSWYGPNSAAADRPYDHP